MGNGASLGHGLIEELQAFRNQSIVRYGFAQHGQVHLRAYQILSQTVMKFAGEFPALLVLHLQQAHAESAQ